MLLFFSATVFWGISVTVIKSPALASMLLHPDSLKIVQLSDVHYTTSSPNRGSRMLADSRNLLEDAIYQINKMDDVDVVVFSGDSINSPLKNDLISFAKIANRLKYPWYYALGNHEVSVSGDFTKEKVIIVQHFPVVEPCKSMLHKTLDAKEYLEVLDKHNNVVAVLSGHYHCAKVTQRNNVLHISSPSLVQYPNSFNVINISDDSKKIKVEVKTISTRLENVKEQSLKQLGKNAKAYAVNVKPEASVFYLSKPQIVDLNR